MTGAHRPTKPTGPASGHRGGATAARRAAMTDQPGPAHVHAEHGGGVVAEGEDVEPAAEQHAGRRRRARRPAPAGSTGVEVALHQRAVAPGEQPDRRLLEQQHEQRGQRAAARARSRSRPGSAGSARTAPPAESAITRPAAASPPTKASPPAGSTGRRQPERGRGHHGEVGAGVDGERVGRRERVAGQRLQRGAGDAERDADRRRRPAGGAAGRRPGPARRPRRPLPKSQAEQVGGADREVPWVRWTAASTSTTATAPTANAPATRSRRTADGRPASAAGAVVTS